MEEGEKGKSPWGTLQGDRNWDLPPEGGDGPATPAATAKDTKALPTPTNTATISPHETSNFVTQ